MAMAVCAAAQPPPLEPRKKKKNEDKEPVTQTLPLLRDPPAAIAAETGKLVFHVSPLSDKGLLSQQTRDALNALMKLNRGAQIVKLRAFVAGTGDMRRVQTLVSEIFTDKKQPLPALSTIQVGALPMEGAQVVLEGISADKRTVNPGGLAFLSGQKGAGPAAAVAQLDAAAKTAGVAAADMLRVTCFLSSLDQAAMARESVAQAFPGAAADFVQALRASPETSTVCEAVGRRTRPGEAVALTPAAALVSTPKLIFSGTQMAFRESDPDLRLAFQRLEKALEPLGVSYKGVVFASYYPLTRAIAARAAAISAEFLAPTPQTTLLFEGLPSLDATVAVEVVAAK
jgi:enamine deaminase RidA (YjgF/YER057c/UK114 family)